MNFIDLSHTFEINEKLGIEVKEESWGKYLIVDNFWKRPEKIKEYCLTYHPVKLPGVYSSPDNGSKYYDGRIKFVFDEMPLFTEVVYYLAYTYFNKHELRVRQHNPYILSGNIFEMYDLDYNKFSDHSYAPHIDGDDQIAATWYMNTDYSSDEGTGVYDCVPHMKNTPWCTGANLIGKMPAKYNRMVLYESHIPHGQLVTDRWFSEKRISLVQFFDTKY